MKNHEIQTLIEIVITTSILMVIFYYVLKYIRKKEK